MDLSNYTLSFNGTTDISEGLNIVIRKFENVFKDELINMVAESMTDKVLQSINELLIDVDPFVPVMDTGLEMNYTLLKSP